MCRKHSKQLQFVLPWLVAIIFVCLHAGVGFSQEDSESWPRQLDGDEATIIMYQPQFESFSGNILEGRAAISVTTPEQRAPVFGAVWFEARMATDMDTRIVSCESLKVTAAKFPDVEETDIQRLTTRLENEIPKWEMTISIDELLATLEASDTAREDTALNNDPPEIIFVTTPTVLVFIDGDPQIGDLEGSDLKYVANTPFFIAHDPKAKRYYLKGGEYWYTTKDLMEDWETMDTLPKSVAEIDKQIREEEKKRATEQGESAPQPPDSDGATPAPEIIVRTHPAELVETSGEPEFSPLDGTELLYMQNSESDILMDIASQQYYVLVSGRWYRSSSMTSGQWEFVANDKLPADFAKIPESSDMAQVRASVAGTQEAKEAVLENQIPQTAEVDRKTATVTVTYDGDPQFEKCAPDVAYAKNTDKSVLLINNTYYCCNDAVWFVSKGPEGPWEVATEVPKQVQDIPPDCPAYNVKYVYIYDSTPDVVYVGYTPAYMGAYYYGGVVVWGTGYYYRPWYSYYYYPRPVTYGFSAHYNPYTGWGFSFGVSYGFLHVSFGRPYYGGCWGPAGYRHGYRHGYHHGYRHGYHNGARAGYRAGYRAGQSASNRNMYRTQQGAARTGVKPSTRPASRPSTGQRPTTAQRKKPKTANKPNNVYAGKDGSVYRKQGNDIQQRNKNGWSNSSQKKSNNVNRDAQARKRSNQRSKQNNANRSKQRQRSGGRRR